MKTRIVYNRFIPIGGFQAMTVWPWIFVRKAVKDYVMTHELIHCRQQEEVHMASLALILTGVLLGMSPLFVLATPTVYFLWYGIEYIVRAILYRSLSEAYRNISFEQEAYMHQMEAGYPASRKVFAWVRFIGKRTNKR